MVTMSFASVLILVSLLASVALASSTFVNGTIYYDCNGNGIYDRNELPFPNAKVILSDAATGKNISTSISTPSGSFSFTVAQKEVYSICASLPSSIYFFTVPSTGCLAVTVQTSSVTGLLFGVNEKLEVLAPASVIVSCTSSTLPSQTGIPVTKSCPGTTPVLTYTDTSTIPCQGAMNIIRTWTAVANGQVVSVTQAINVVDNMPPVIVVPRDATVECGHDTSPGITGFATASDACATTTLTFTDSAPQGLCPQIFFRTWVASDPCGNTATGTQKISSQDTIPPSFVSFPPDVTVPFGSSTDPSSTGTPVATDSCSTPTVTYRDTTTPTPQGTTILRTWTAADQCGHTSSRRQQIFVLNPPSL